jgi:beta-phosphoglucomutase-like phosphatase (HAD superfamily)
MSNGNGKAESVAVLFDFDGTVGDTETPAMEVAFWEAAPYLVGICECSHKALQHHNLTIIGNAVFPAK